jgi:hypothetical protein
MTLPEQTYSQAGQPAPSVDRRRGFPEVALSGAASFWLLTALIGQWAFSWYIANFYGSAMVSGHYEAWKVLRALGATGGYIAGDAAGNRIFGAHALAAGFIAFSGALQFVPQIRNRWPVFHRWNGRLFLLTVTALSLSGFYLVWVRHTSPNPLSAISTTVNGVLILSFAALAWRTAVARRFDVHPRWALRLYLVSNAQWFLRIGLFAYFVANMAVGRKPSMSDPFLTFWTPGCYLVPLVVAELYLRARDGGGASARLAVAAILVGLTLFMGLGVFAFAMFSQRILSGAPLHLPG